MPESPEQLAAREKASFHMRAAVEALKQSLPGVTPAVWTGMLLNLAWMTAAQDMGIEEAARTIYPAHGLHLGQLLLDGVAREHWDDALDAFKREAIHYMDIMSKAAGEGGETITLEAQPPRDRRS